MRSHHVEVEPDVVVARQVRVVGAEAEKLKVERLAALGDEALAVEPAGRRQVLRSKNCSFRFGSFICLDVT